MSLKIIFKNLSDLSPVLPEFSLSNIQGLKDCDWVSWFKSAPKFSSVRVNTLKYSSEDVVNFLTEQLEQKADLCKRLRPQISIHRCLPDCVLVAPWDSVDLTLRMKEVIVDKQCGAAVLRGSSVFAPGVKGMSSDISEGNEVSVYADVSNSCKRGHPREFIDDLKTFVGNGIAKMNRYQLFNGNELPYGTAVEILDTKSKVCGLKLPSDIGLLVNLPSIVCGYVMDVRNQDDLIVLDMCAAPGNKTSHLACLMQNKGLIIAIDKTKKKISKIENLCKQLSITNIRTFIFDSMKSVDSTGEERNVEDGPPFSPECFDRVLLDAPCSGLGQRPIFDFDISENQLKSFAVLQKRLFSAAVQHVRVGGFLIYSTCTITLRENENLVKWALATYPHLELVSAEPKLGQVGSSLSELSEEECQKVQRFGPPIGDNFEADTIGFFIAKFKKVESVLK